MNEGHSVFPVQMIIDNPNMMKKTKHFGSFYKHKHVLKCLLSLCRH